MDYNKYYDMQSRGLAGFRGPVYQKGHGLGSMFKRLFRWAIPIIQRNAAPIIEGIHSSVSEGLNNFHKDLGDGDDDDNKTSIKESVKRRLLETFNNIKENFVPKSNQAGSGKKRKRRQQRQPAVKRNKPNFKNIFDE